MSSQARRILIATLIMIGITWLPVPPESRSAMQQQRASADAASLLR